MSKASATDWNIALSSWIIQDGNYRDFEVGQIAEFAVEFWPSTATAAPSGEDVSAKWVRDSLYDTVAQIVFQTAEITVFDIGVLVYSESERLAPSLRGPRTALRLGLGVDPFFYFESLSRLPGVPPLVYSWRIQSILRQTAPFIEKTSEAGPMIGRKVLVRDPQRLGYEEINKTDAWNDDSGRAEYLLRCDLLPIAPKHESATAT